MNTAEVAAIEDTMDGMAKHEAFTRMSGEQLRRAAMWILASGVAAIAAIVSYSHIYDLGRAHGGSGAAARLLPLSVDMLILVGELMLLHEADAKGKRFPLAWVLIWSGIAATMAANVTYGAQFGIEGAIIWGWPAYSFIAVAAAMVRVIQRQAKADAPVPEPEPEPVAPVVAPSAEAILPAETPAPETAPEPALVAVPRRAVTAARKPARSKSVKAAAKTRVPGDVDTQAQALAIIAEDPGISGSELGRQLGMTPAYGRQLKNRLAGSVAGPDSNGVKP
jgi:Protein of unknown function (DUF2637)